MKRGIAAGAAVLFDEHGHELVTEAKLLRGVTTPIAEYTALHLALQIAAAWAGPSARETDLLILGDAELIVRQVDGRYRCEKSHLLVMRDMAHLLMRSFASCEVREFPKAGPDNKRRYGNARADELAGHCLNGLPIGARRWVNVPELGGGMPLEVTAERFDAGGCLAYRVNQLCRPFAHGLVIRAQAMEQGKEVNDMDPNTQSERMEDVRPEASGFIDDNQTDVEALADIEQHDDESGEDDNDAAH